MDKQFYIELGGEKIPVDEEVYRAYMRPVWAEEKRKQRDTDDNVTPLSLDGLMENGYEPGDGTDITSVIHDKMLLEALFAALSELKPDEQELIRDIYQFKKTEREIAEALGLSQKAVNKRKAKALGKLSQNEALKRIYRN